MKINKIFLGLAFAAVALFTACNTDQEGAVYSATGNQGLAFSAPSLGSIRVPANDPIYTITVYRGNKSGAFTGKVVPLLAQVGGEDVNASDVCAISDFAFADGSNSATFTVNVDKLPMGKTLDLKLACTDSLNLSPTYHEGMNEVSFSISKEYSWVALGKGHYSSPEWWEEEFDVDIMKADGYPVYKILSLFEEGYDIEFEITPENYVIVHKQASWVHSSYGVVSLQGYYKAGDYVDVAGLYHASMLGVQMANEIHKKYGARMFTVDPTVVDEYCDLARITGVKDVYRRPASHVLNTKEAGRRYAASIGKKYEDLNLIICHIDGGITISAHAHGKMIDGNNGGGGEGPFTPTRMGSMPITLMLSDMPDVTRDQLKVLCSAGGGFSSWFNTSDSDKIHAKVDAGDPKATRIWKAMVYQICKWIGAMATVLKGHVDGIVLTGGLMRFNDILQRSEGAAWGAGSEALYGQAGLDRFP